ncbi:MAG TPA: hypothetical protein VFW10_08705 [Steroidobacteraceae bacterium]|nr:hypothetical protein [Steroidobacteraceae bacterium]
MRSDLNKVICEHERRGSHDSYRQVRHKKSFALNEDSPAFESMKARYGGNIKDFGEHLSPLYGQVRKALGRRWDDLYSDLRRNFDARSVINAHILQHLYDRFEKDCYIKNGEIYVGPRHFRYGGWRLRDQRNVEFYVDPRDGIIKRNPWYGYREPIKELPVTLVELDRDHVLRKVNGLWFHFTMADVPSGQWRQDTKGGWRFVSTRVTDVFDGTYKEDAREQYSRVGGRSRVLKPLRYHAEKRSASKADLRRAGLR